MPSSFRLRWPLHVLWLGLALLLTVVIPATAQAEIPEYDSEFFTDLTGQVTGKTKMEIRKTLRVGSEASRVHAMLVLVNAMGDYPELPQDILPFATQLANEWKIGDHETHKGILAVFALSDRKFAIAKTSNLDTTVTDGIKAAVGGRVSDKLKAGDVPKAMLLAAETIADKLPEFERPKSSTAAAPTHTKTVTRTTTTRQPTVTYAPTRRSSGWGFGWIFGILVIVVIALVIRAIIRASRHGYGPSVGGGSIYGGGPGYGPTYGGGWGGGGSFLGGMMAGGALGYLLGDRGHGGYYGGGGWGGHNSGWGGGGYTETTTTETETWSSGGGDGGSDWGGGGGFDSFGGGDFDGGGSFGEW